VAVAPPQPQAVGGWWVEAEGGDSKSEIVGGDTWQVAAGFTQPVSTTLLKNKFQKYTTFQTFYKNILWPPAKQVLALSVDGSEVIGCTNCHPVCDVCLNKLLLINDH
jgi:hypothetical protein